MSKGNWIIAATLGLTLWAAPGWPQTASEDEPRDESSATASDNGSDQRQINATDIGVALEGIESAIRDLIAEEVQIAREAQDSRERRDLNAQEGMAWWAELMFYATGATVVLTFIALIAIIRTLHHTRRAADAAEVMTRDTKSIGTAQVRAYLHCSKAKYQFTDDGLGIILQIENAGQSPATFVTVAGTCGVSLIGGFEKMPRVLASLHSDASDNTVDPIPAQGVMDGSLTFLWSYHFDNAEPPPNRRDKA